jgi:AcrR family transcriptional regulator
VGNTSRELATKPAPTLSTARLPAWRAGRRTSLLDAADRVIRREGAAASMEEMAAEAGITKPVLYRYFGDKGGLYQALAERYVDALMAELRRALGQLNPRRRLAATIDAYLEFVEHNRGAYDFLMRRAIRERPEAEETVSGFIDRVSEEVAVVLRHELERAGLDPRGAEVWAHGLVGMVQVAGDWWLDRRQIPRRRVVDDLAALLWSGLSNLPRPAGKGRS